MRSKFMMTSALCATFLFVCLSASSSSAERKGIMAGLRSGEYSSKIMRISGLMAAELLEKGVRSVRVEAFRDGNGRETEEGWLMRDEFLKGLSSAEKGIKVIRAGKADAILSGTLMPFKGRDKWRLRIKVVHADTGEPITSYEGYFIRRGQGRD